MHRSRRPRAAAGRVLAAGCAWLGLVASAAGPAGAAGAAGAPALSAPSAARPASPGALVVFVAASPPSLPSGGGMALVRGRVRDAATCQLTLRSRQPFPVVFSHNPTTTCRGGSFTAKVTVGPNTGVRPRVVAISVVARAGPSSSSGTFYIVLAGALPATVLSATTTPKALPAAGGTVLVTARVAHATSCRLRLRSRQSFPVVYSHGPRSCRQGSFSAKVTVGANPAHLKRTVAFVLVASNGGSVSSGPFYVALSPRPAGAGTEVDQLLITTSSLPAATDGLAYSATVSTSGAMGACQWSLASGALPAGLSGTAATGCQWAVSGRPAVKGPANYPFVLDVADSAGEYARVSLSIRVSPAAAPAPVTTTPPATTTTTVTTTGPPPADRGDVLSANWSGYAIGGGPFTAVKGTFTVPYITSGASCTQDLSEWVGVDGSGPANPASQLVQAGISESKTDPVTGNCTAGQFYAWSWWEILPAVSTPIGSVHVQAGDRVSVAIWQVSGTEFAISVDDLTDGQQYTTQQSYSGPLASAEWVVEAPVVPAECGAGVDPSFMTGVCELAPYTPEVAFTGLGITGPAREIWRLIMAQHGARVSTPSPLVAGSFRVFFTGGY